MLNRCLRFPPMEEDHTGNERSDRNARTSRRKPVGVGVGRLVPPTLKKHLTPSYATGILMTRAGKRDEPEEGFSRFVCSSQEIWNLLQASAVRDTEVLRRLTGGWEPEVEMKGQGEQGFCDGSKCLYTNSRSVCPKMSWTISVQGRNQQETRRSPAEARP